MVAPLVTEPTLKKITLRYLIAHAEQPQLLKASRNRHLREFSKKERFDEEFFARVKEKLPGYSREMLYRASEHMPQKDFKTILGCFKEISGIWNPLHYSELGRVIPTTQDGVTTLASTMAGPKMVIKSSRAYNDDFNTDQEIILEQLTTDKVMGNVKATVQHYMLPSVEPHYLEMVTASLGYWEAIPRLWNWPIYGKTKITDVQIPLEELILRDYSYLNIDYEEKGDYILLNGKRVGLRVRFKESIENSLGYSPEKDYLVKNLDEFSPIQILENFEINGDLIFPEGTRYGSPCNRYELDIPQPNFITRFWYAMGEVYRMSKRSLESKLEIESKEKDYSILVRIPQEAILADSLAIAQNAEVDRAIARAETAEAEAEAAIQEMKAKEAEAKNRRYQREAQTLGNLGKIVSRHTRHRIVNVIGGVDKKIQEMALRDLSKGIYIIYLEQEKNQAYESYVNELFEFLELEDHPNVTTAVISNSIDTLSWHHGGDIQAAIVELLEVHDEIKEKIESELSESDGSRWDSNLDSLMSPVKNFFDEIKSPHNSICTDLVNLGEEIKDAFEYREFPIKELIDESMKRAQEKGNFDYSVKLLCPENHNMQCRPEVLIGGYRDIGFNILQAGGNQLDIIHGLFSLLSQEERERFSPLISKRKGLPSEYTILKDNGRGFDSDENRNYCNEILSNQEMIEQLDSSGKKSGTYTLRDVLNAHNATGAYFSNQPKSNGETMVILYYKD